MIAVVFLIYIAIAAIGYFNSKHIVGYEVMEGSLSSDNLYEAIAIRSEKIVTAQQAGYVNYFATEGRRVAVGNLVYTVDETGQLLDLLKSQGTSKLTLGDHDLSELRTQIINYHATYQPSMFSSVYDFRTSLSETVQKLSNSSMLESLESLSNSSSSINYCRAEDTGIVIYSTDGFENTRLNDMTADLFDESKYEKKQLVGNALVAAGDPVYKLSSDENWAIIIQTTPEKSQELVDLAYVKVRFLKNQNESWGSVSTYTNPDGDTFVQLSFTNSMLTFATDRFLNVELITEEEKGLKIPNSSIVEKNFFVVPKDFVTDGQDGKKGVLRTCYLEDGTRSTEFVDTEVYNETETTYFVDESVLRAGDELQKTDSSQTFTVSTQENLIGVYNINKGYADFKQIHILYQNDEYAIVQSNTQYGLSVYDYIVLDTSTVNENELIYG